MLKAARVVLASSFVIGCGPVAPKPVGPERDAPERAISIANGEPLTSSPGMPASPAGFASSDLALMIGGEVSAWSITDGKLIKTGSAKVAKVDVDDIPESILMGIGLGGWADRDHLFVTVGTREIVMITAHAITRVAMPPASTFEVPKPADPDGDLVRGSEAEMGGDELVVTAGEAYWSQCAWGLPYDGFQCRSWVHARLWPTPGVDKDAPARASRTWDWAATPAGFTAKANSKVVACSGPGSKSSIPAGTGGGEPDEEIEGVHWVSTQPPRLLVSYGRPGLADVIPERWTLHEGCIVAPLASGTTATPGPSGLWIGTTTDRYNGPATLYRGATIIGELPEHATVMLRPPK